MHIYKGIGVSDGVAIGKVLKINSAFINYPRIQFEDDEPLPRELERIAQAKIATEAQIDQIMQQSADLLSEDFKGIFAGYKMFLQDKSLVPAIMEKIKSARINAEWALIIVIAELGEKFSAIPDPYIKARFDDIRQLGERLMNNLQQRKMLDLSHLKQPVVLVCHDLSPADAFHLNKSNILGIISELGGVTSHSSILARAMNIPAVVGVSHITSRLRDDAQIILDGSTGEVYDDPTEEVIQQKLDKLEQFNFYQNQLLELVEQDCALSDGHKVRFAANLDYINELKQIDELGIPSIGLIRTEFLFLLDHAFPEEEEQYELYSKIAEQNQFRPMTIRTWDIGADKSSKLFPELQEEANPALGLRAIRLCLKHPSFFRTQIRAILRVSERCPVNLMLPMITRIDEVVKAKKIIQEELLSLGIQNDNLAIGCMVETPSSTFIIDELLDLVDFISIGTNDLIQYSLAVDRMNENVADLFAPFHPAILKMLEQIVSTANRRGKDVSICGEMAADHIMQMFLIGVGEITFSMSPHQILPTKRILKKVDWKTCKKIAFQFVNKHSLQESVAYANRLREIYEDEFLKNACVI